MLSSGAMPFSGCPSHLSVLKFFRSSFGAGAWEKGSNGVNSSRDNLGHDYYGIRYKELISGRSRILGLASGFQLSLI